MAAKLGKLIDGCRAASACEVTEGISDLTISNVKADSAVEISRAIAELGWECVLRDSSESLVSPADIRSAWEPYLINITKPHAADVATIFVLTTRGFEQLLDSEGAEAYQTWRVAPLQKSFRTWTRQFIPWEGTAESIDTIETKSPRELVREAYSLRRVPKNIGDWLLKQNLWLEEESAYLSWATRAAQAVLFSLVGEIMVAPDAVVFPGPPRKQALMPDGSLLDAIGVKGFLTLQSAATWVYEAPGESETRHLLFAAELGRILGSSEAGLERLADGDAAVALEGAKIAYQLGMSKLSSDTLKMLGDLRKSVLDETAKIADGTRTMIGAVATTLSVGIGLIAARVAAGASALLVGSITCVMTLYVITVAFAGWRVIDQQKNLRNEWKNRTYGFLLSQDYEKLVEEPTKAASDTYGSVARVGIILSLVMLVIVILALGHFE